MMKDILPLSLPGIPSARPLLIAGPCSAESPEQLLETARALSAGGVRVFRAGLWKPRTKPGGFEGVGDQGLEWLQQVKQQTGMLTATEVAMPEHVEKALAAGIDLLWLGARTTANPFAVQQIADALAGHDVPVLVKNPVSPDLELWIGAIQRLYNAGLRRIAAGHRGFSTYTLQIYRNHPQWAIPIELHRRLPALQLLCDPSHIGGNRDLIAPLSRQAMELGFDGLIVETHCNPDSALSDSGQQITPEAFHAIVRSLVLHETNRDSELLRLLRRRIDKLDNELIELLAQRMQVVRELGRYKQQHNMPVLQSVRYNEMLRTRASEGERMGMPRPFIEQLLQTIHEESIRQQFDEIGNKIK
jgi:chorismate mutase